MRYISSGSTATTSSRTYTDIIGATLSTNYIGPTGSTGYVGIYNVVFIACSYRSAATAATRYILNINGVDQVSNFVTISGTTRGISTINFNTTMASGVIAKARWLAPSGTTTLLYYSLSITGFPSQIVKQ